jgi:hypothetical protein
MCVCSCYYGRWLHRGGVSLNRREQQLFEYIGANRDERQFWENKVRVFDAKSPDRAEVARLIESELWRYFLERSAVVPIFKEAAEREGLRRMSMLNLAEHLMRIWLPPRVAKRSPT